MLRKNVKETIVSQKGRKVINIEVARNILIMEISCCKIVTWLAFRIGWVAHVI